MVTLGQLMTLPQVEKQTFSGLWRSHGDLRSVSLGQETFNTAINWLSWHSLGKLRTFYYLLPKHTHTHTCEYKI